jgi:hypothetical protein
MDIAAWLIKTILGSIISLLVPWFLKRVLPKPEALREGHAPGVARFPWFGWIAGLAVAGGLAGIVSGVMGLVLGGVANWAVFGALIGIVQWLYLYRLVDVSPWVALASTLGWAMFIFIQPIGHPTWAVIGLVVGVLQWFGLLGKVNRAVWWVPANALAWFVAGMVGIAVGAAVTDAANVAIGWVVGWVCVGAVGAVVLVMPLSWMWKRTSGMNRKLFIEHGVT